MIQDVRLGRDPELQELVAGDGPRSVEDLQPRPRVLLLRGGRPLGDGRRRPDRPGAPRDRRDRPGPRSSSVVIDGCVVRMPKAYPVYDDVVSATASAGRSDAGWRSASANLELAGRNGMHKYNNQDHSMMTALLAARNILGLGRYDTWKVNTDAQYHEGEADAPEDARSVPRKVAAGA